MRASDEDALICDFTQYYGIYDPDTLPLKTQAVLACGLPAESRTMKKIAGMTFTIDTLLAAAILDQLRIRNWQNTKSASKRQNFPESITDKLLHGEEEKAKKDEVQTFDTGDEFMRRRQSLLDR